MKRFIPLLLATLAWAKSDDTPRCRCRPHHDCWPSHKEWGALNSSIHGNLVTVQPAAAVCHEPLFDSSACATVTEQWSNMTWRAATPGAVQWTNWEAWPEHGEYCYLENPENTPCKQGRISLYSALVESSSDIQKAVNFAKRHNLRLAVKNSGHDFLGRSTAPESLQILVNGMKDIDLVDDFVPAGASDGDGEGPAVTIAAGVTVHELYAAVAAKRRVAVGGSFQTIGVTGGYIQGGGHSPIGTWKGLASDNALEFQVVTANVGDLVHANAYQNQDLFWALRGGGGGTFGVVTRVTLRTFDEAPVVISSLNISTPTGSPDFWSAMTACHASLPDLNGAGGSGYYTISPIQPVDGVGNLSVFSLGLIFPDQTDPGKINDLHAPLLSKLNETDADIQYAALPFPSVGSSVQLLAQLSTNLGGVPASGGSRLFSRDLLASEKGPAKLVSALKRLRYEPGQLTEGIVVAGGAVAANGKTVDSAVNPAWRKTITHISVGRILGPTWEEQKATRDYFTNVAVPILKSVEGEDAMGAYMNEADPDERDFQSTFWGENYPRLYEIKQKWDPTGLFIARKGVGSEDWDDAGLCLVGK